MPKFGRRSKDKLNTCDERIQDIMNEVIKHLDISIISGYRTALEQDLLYEKGFSKVQFPNSNHNCEPSMAVDVMLWNKEKQHIRWEDKTQMSLVAGFVIAVAKLKGIKLRWGGDWDGNLITSDNWFDGGHFELLRS